MSVNEPLLIPVGNLGGRLDNDSPSYVFAPDLYLSLALCYDSLAAPAASRDQDGVWSPDFTQMQPRLAAAWYEEPSGNWMISLREGVLSHTGNEWNAENLAWTFERAFAQDVMGAWRWRGVIGTQSVEVIDRFNVRFHLRAPYPTFSNWLISVSPNMVDSAEVRQHATPEDPWGLEWLDSHVSGFGAYGIEELSADVVRFAARSDYWGGPPAHGQIEVRPWEDRADAVAQLFEDRPVVVVGIDPDETARLMKHDELTVVRSWAGHVSVEMDFTQPPYDDALVRHALAFATPYDQVREDGLNGLARPWLSPVKGISQWYRNEPLPYRYDVEHARELLARSGYAGGFDADLYIVDKPYCMRMAEIIARAWAKIGVELTIKTVTGTPDGWMPPLYLRTECAHNISEPLYDIAHDYAAMHPILPAPGGEPHVGNWNPRWVKNPDVIEDFLAVLLSDNANEKRRLFDALQEKIIGFGATVFLGEMQQTLAANKRVDGSLISPSSRFFHALEYQNATTNYLPAHKPSVGAFDGAAK
jgi:ABC-type transport system substrate-binding protein